VLRAPGACRSLSGSQALMRGVSFFSRQVSIIGHEHTAHIDSRQQVYNEKMILCYKITCRALLRLIEVLRGVSHLRVRRPGLLR
jgi:hypothetical protein